MNTLGKIAILAGERATALVASNHVITVRPETPLDVLSKFALPVPASDVNELGMFGECPEFQQTLEIQADFLAEAVGKHRDFACNVASPAIQASVEKARELIAQIQMDATLGFNIQPAGASTLLSDADFMNYVSRFYTGTYHMDLYPNYPLYNTEQLVALLATNDAIDAASLKTILDGGPEGYLDVVWQSVFLSKTLYAPTVRVERHHDIMTDYMSGGNGALLVFMLAATLYNNITDDVGMDLAAAQKALLEIAATAAHYVRRAQEYAVEMRQGGFMVQEYNLKGRTIKVDADLYAKWEAEGGKPEALLGALVSDKMPRTVEAINGIADVLVAEWDNYRRAKQGELDSLFYTQVNTVLRQVFRDSIESGNLAEPEAEMLALPGARAKAESIFLFHLDSATGAELRKNWTEIYWRAAARGRFYYSNAYEILSDIDYEIRERNADPDDAATTAMTNAVSRYIASMMVCRPTI